MEKLHFQHQLSKNYLNGSAGAFVAAAIWLISAICYQFKGVQLSFAVLFFGGMLIFPFSIVILKLFFKRSADSKGNVGAYIIIETLPAMIFGFFFAWLLLKYNSEFVIPVSTIAVGAHYFGFRSAYGDYFYYSLGVLICCLGLAAIFIKAFSSLDLLYSIALTEFIFALVLKSRSSI